MDKIIAACGNNCAACPRYVAHPFEPKCREVCTDEEYIKHEVEFALPRAQCLELIPEHITGKLVNES